MLWWELYTQPWSGETAIPRIDLTDIGWALYSSNDVLLLWAPGETAEKAWARVWELTEVLSRLWHDDLELPMGAPVVPPPGTNRVVVSSKLGGKPLIRISRT